jgi:hypothetical protein
VAGDKTTSVVFLIDVRFLAVAAVVVWLLGKAARVVLSGPTKETTRPHSPSVVHRNTSVPVTGDQTPARPVGPIQGA